MKRRTTERLYVELEVISAIHSRDAPDIKYQISETWSSRIITTLQLNQKVTVAYSVKIPGTGKFFRACESSSENSLGPTRNVLALAVDDR